MPQIEQQPGDLAAVTLENPALTGLWQQLAQTNGSTLKVWLWLCGHLHAPEGADLPLSLIQAGTGLARSSVIRALGDLIRRGVISGQERIGVVTRYRWATPAPAIGAGEGRVDQDAAATPNATRPLLALVPTPFATPTRPKSGWGYPIVEQDTRTKIGPVGIAQEPVASAAVPGARQETPASAAEPISFCDGVPRVNRIESTDLLTLEKEMESSHAATRPPPTGLPDALTTQIARWGQCLQPGVAPAAAKATHTRAARLWQQSGQAAADFGRLLDVAGRRTLGRMAQAGGRPVRCPISYFFQVLMQLVAALPPVSASLDQEPQMSVPAVPAPLVVGLPGDGTVLDDPPATVVDIAGRANADPMGVAVRTTPAGAGLPPAGLWRQALVRLQLELPDDYARVLRYAQLVELQPTTGQSRINVPSEWMRRQMVERLTGPIGAVLTALVGQPVGVQVGVQ